MGEVIYSASPLQAFMGSFGAIAFLSFLGVIGLGVGIFRRKEKTLKRLAILGLSILLIAIGVALAFSAFRSMTGGSLTFTAQLNDKLIAKDNCSDGGTCTRYVLETQSGSKIYDLNVTKETYEKAQVSACYAVTYYPSASLLGEPSYADSYEAVSNITQIETVVCP